MYLGGYALLLVYGFAPFFCVGCALLRRPQALAASLLLLYNIPDLLVSCSVTRLNSWRVLFVLGVASFIPFIYVVLLLSTTGPFPCISSTSMAVCIMAHAWSVWSMCFAYFYVFILHAITSYTSRNSGFATTQQASTNTLLFNRRGHSLSKSVRTIL